MSYGDVIKFLLQHYMQSKKIEYTLEPKLNVSNSLRSVTSLNVSTKLDGKQRVSYTLSWSYKYHNVLCNNMSDELDKPIVLEKCLLEKDGTVTCSIKKETFNELQRKNIKPKRLIWELE